MDTLRLLQGYLLAYPEDQEELEELLSAARAGEPLTRRDCLPGHLTASALILSQDGQRLALLYHQGLQRWLQPGGHIEEEDSSLLEAAQREAREELGLTDLAEWAPPSSPGRPWQIMRQSIPAREKTGEPAHLHYDARFILRCLSPSQRLRGEEGLQSEWYPIPRALQLTPDLSPMLDRLRAAAQYRNNRPA